MICIATMLFVAGNASETTDVGMKDAIIEKTGFYKVLELAEKLGLNDSESLFSQVLTGEISVEPEQIEEYAVNAIKTAFAEIKRHVIKISMPAILGIIMGMVFGRKSGNLRGVRLFCRIAVSCAMAEMYLQTRNSAERLIENIALIAETVTPVLISLLTLTGAATTASLLSPLSAFCAQGGVILLKSTGIMLVDAGAIIAFTGNLSENFRLKRLFSLIKSVVTWLSGVLVASFTTLLSLQGMIGKSADSAAVKSIQYTAESLIPIIGGNVSESMGSIMASTSMIRSAMGVTSIVIVIIGCAAPVLDILACMIAMKMAAAVFEPAADPCMIDTASQFADIAQMMIILCAGAAMMVIILVGAGISAAGSITG